MSPKASSRKAPVVAALDPIPFPVVVDGGADGGTETVVAEVATIATTATGDGSQKTACKKRTRKPKLVYNASESGGCVPPLSSDDENIILKLTLTGGTSVSPAPNPYNDTHDTTTSYVDDTTTGGAVLLFPVADDFLLQQDADTPDTVQHERVQHERVQHERVQHERVQQHDNAPPPLVHGTHSHVKNGGAGLKVIRLLSEFEEKNKSGEWPSGTSVHCYWCCHRFNNAPFGMPVKLAGNMFHVVGCYCSLECACAYNFANKDISVDECLDRYAMLNALSERIGMGRVVKPAPDRLALNIFGGHLDVNEFRAFASSNRKIVVNSPPMLTMTQQVEEVHDTDMRSEYRYIPLDSERINRYQEKIRLKRNKPLVNFKNTLDHTMKLKYVNA